MSSTNRSQARDLHIADYYVTPIDEIITFLKEFEKVESGELTKGTILDPAAGGDLNHPMSYPEALIRCGVNKNKIKTIDIRKDSLAENKEDYLKVKLDYKPYVIITNPPFNQALEIITKALDDVDDNGWVIMLLRLNFLETKVRKDFFDKQLPKYIFVHHKRMSFTDDGKRDSIAYAHYVWRKGYMPNFTLTKVI
jgi:hypothetical protein